MKETTINQRIKMLVDYFDKGNKLAFSKRVGVSNQGIGEIVGDRQSNPSFPNLRKIALALPQVRTSWLLLGEGEMLKPAPDRDAGINNSVVSEPDKTPKTKDIDVLVSPTLLRGDEIKRPGMPAMNYLTPDEKPKKVGLDLVEQIAVNTEAIQELRDAISRIEKQLK